MDFVINNFPEYTISKSGIVKKNKIPITQSNHNQGYKFVRMKNKCGLWENKYIHRLLAEQFIPNPKEKPNINHKNGITYDNRIDNLEWCNQSENIKHAYDNGMINKTYKHINGKLNEKEVINLRFLSERLKVVEIAKMFNVTRQTVYNIVNRKTYKHL